MTLKLITAPAALAVSLDDAKMHCRIDGATEDSWLTATIKAATLAAEHHTGRRFITQTWEAVYDAFPSGGILLGAAPIQSITSLSYVDASGIVQTLAANLYVLDSESPEGFVLPAAGTGWPDTYDTVNAVRVRYVCGYGADSTAVPENARLWILMQVGTAYKHRESIATGVSVSEMPNRYHDALLDPLRVWSL